MQYQGVNLNVSMYCTCNGRHAFMPIGTHNVVPLDIPVQGVVAVEVDQGV